LRVSNEETPDHPGGETGRSEVFVGVRVPIQFEDGANVPTAHSIISIGFSDLRHLRSIGCVASGSGGLDGARGRLDLALPRRVRSAFDIFMSSIMVRTSDSCLGLRIYTLDAETTQAKYRLRLRFAIAGRQ
jgi:hypothetical protein